MYEYFVSVILGIVEGITEFLPISSTGHLIIVGKFLGFQEPFDKTFDVVIQLGAILSVICYFHDRLIPPLFPKTQEEIEKRNEIFDVWFKAVCAVVPALVIGFILGKKIQNLLFNPETVAITLFVGGVILIIIERKEREHKFNDIGSMSYKTAFFIGLFQCLAMIPGTSRSAATIIGAMFLGASRKTAAEFSFFLAIPTMCAASAYSLMKSGANMTPDQWALLVSGFTVSFLVAWGVIALFMEFIRTRTFSVFGYYRILLAIAIVLYFFVFKP
jgi:undecaprenyl-diphosphatase